VAEKYDGYLDRKKQSMSSIDWKADIEIIAGPIKPSDTRESWLARAARKSGIKQRLIKALFYSEMTDPRVSVALKIWEAAKKARLEEAQREALALSNTFKSLAEGMSTNENFNRKDVAALLDAARILGNADRA
jgi:hypothetical protein